MAFWSFGSVCPSPLPRFSRLPLVNRGQTANRSCQLWWEVGDCSVPAPKSERLCLDPPCRAELHLHWAHRCVLVFQDEWRLCWWSCVQLFSFVYPFRILLACLNSHLLVTFTKERREVAPNMQVHSRKIWNKTPYAGHKSSSCRRRKQLSFALMIRIKCTTLGYILWKNKSSQRGPRDDTGRFKCTNKSASSLPDVYLVRAALSSLVLPFDSLHITLYVSGFLQALKLYSRYTCMRSPTPPPYLAICLETLHMLPRLSKTTPIMARNFCTKPPGLSREGLSFLNCPHLHILTWRRFSMLAARRLICLGTTSVGLRYQKMCLSVCVRVHGCSSF